MYYPTPAKKKKKRGEEERGPGGLSETTSLCLHVISTPPQGNTSEDLPDYLSALGLSGNWKMARLRAAVYLFIGRLGRPLQVPWLLETAQLNVFLLASVLRT